MSTEDRFNALVNPPVQELTEEVHRYLISAWCREGDASSWVIVTDHLLPRYEDYMHTALDGQPPGHDTIPTDPMQLWIAETVGYGADMLDGDYFFFSWEPYSEIEAKTPPPGA